MLSDMAAVRLCDISCPWKCACLCLPYGREEVAATRRSSSKAHDAVSRTFLTLRGLMSIHVNPKRTLSFFARGGRPR